jgi:hypothetical protein
MTHRGIPLMTALGLFLGISTGAMAQTAGTITEPIAPGAGLPAGSIGGLSPQNVPIAPGAAAPATEQIGPGGIRLAPGSVGSAGAPLVTTPAEPGTRGTRVR